MFMNYMDYTNDACMNLFTNDQKSRMIAAINQYRPNLLNHNLCSGGTTPNSWDCIKNLGFSESFKRLWNYYLGYCEGGFKSGNINVGQFLIKKV